MCVTSSPQAKNLKNGLRSPDTCSRIVPRNIGYCVSSASRIDRLVTSPSISPTSTVTSPLTPPKLLARVVFPDPGWPVMMMHFGFLLMFLDAQRLRLSGRVFQRSAPAEC